MVDFCSRHVMEFKKNRQPQSSSPTIPLFPDYSPYLFFARGILESNFCCIFIATLNCAPAALALTKMYLRVIALNRSSKAFSNGNYAPFRHVKQTFENPCGK
jgi:hypothetical protein